jgi:hypothetical protein
MATAPVPVACTVGGNEEWRMERTHVAIVDLPPLQAEILDQRLGREVGFEVEPPLAGPLAKAAGALDGIDVLITGSAQTDPAVVGEVLAHHPRLTILSIRPDGRGSVLARLVPEVVVLGDASPHELVARLGQRPARWDEVLAGQLRQDDGGDPTT